MIYHCLSMYVLPYICNLHLGTITEVLEDAKEEGEEGYYIAL